MKTEASHRNIRRRCFAFVFSCCLFFYQHAYCQLYVFAELKGAPMSTAGWTTTGTAHVGNVTSLDHSELILCTNGTGQTGSIFYNQPIDLSKCDKWKAEFDFRIYDGTAADGIAFCFLNVPPSGFVSGQGVGIPATSDGLKVVFDTYNNCESDHSFAVPKIELRWGVGYRECDALPTHDNVGGDLSFIRSRSYNHAVISYDAGNISVSVNGKEYLTGFQKIGLTGYLGFTSGTGGNYDNHSIQNVTIYTNVPSFNADKNVSVCAGQTVQIGTASNSLYHYQWTPSAGLSSDTVAQPVVAIANLTDDDISRLYRVTTSLADGSGCTITDSVTVRVKTLSPPSVSIRSQASKICDKDDLPLFTATIKAGGASPQYEWMVNGATVGTNNDTFSIDHLAGSDVINCRLTNAESCAGETTAMSNSISLPVYSSPSVDAGASAAIDFGSTTELHAVTTGNVQSIVWTPSAGLSNTHIASPMVSPGRTTLYTVTVQTTEGCTASDTVSVKVISKGVVVPSAFSPNGDGANDTFKPLVLGNTIAYSFSVYNRWGQRVYQSYQQDIGWDGTIKGDKQPAGAYSWLLACTLDTDVHIEKKGTVVLIR